MTRQDSLFLILPRAIADAIKAKTDIAILHAPIYVDEFAEGVHVYAPKVAIEAGIIYRKHKGVIWEIDAVASPDGSVFYCRVEDAVRAITGNPAPDDDDPLGGIMSTMPPAEEEEEPEEDEERVRPYHLRDEGQTFDGEGESYAERNA